jgi:hypothetical protein
VIAKSQGRPGVSQIFPNSKLPGRLDVTPESQGRSSVTPKLPGRLGVTNSQLTYPANLFFRGWLQGGYRAHPL